MPKSAAVGRYERSFFTTAVALYNHAQIQLRPTSLLTYLADGGRLRLPVAQRPPKRGYKAPNWAPVVFVWTGPSATGAEFANEVCRTEEES